MTFGICEMLEDMVFLFPFPLIFKGDSLSVEEHIILDEHMMLPYIDQGHWSSALYILMGTRSLGSEAEVFDLLPDSINWRSLFSKDLQQQVFARQQLTAGH